MVSLNEQAYEHLKNLIANQQLTYNRIYSETKLSSELGISRTPFRDAIHRLVQEGYIDIIPSKGFQLHQLTKKDVTETFQIRSALEGYCTVEIAKNASTAKAGKLLAELTKLTDSMEHIMQTSHSIEEFIEYDFQFHHKIINYIGNSQFSSIFASYMYRMKRLAALSLAHRGRMENTCREHTAILDALYAGNMEQVYENTLQHMNTPRGINLEDL